MSELPTAFGKYFLTEKIATGGMAEIYLAKLIGPGGFEKQLVIKQILPRFSDERHFVDLFVAEAKTLVGLSHGNIVPIYELGVVDDVYFIAMEYIDGPTLAQLDRAVHDRGEIIDPRTAAYITAEVLKGLDYAHRKGEGVIHRDLSPRNVMLSRDGEVKLVDFGIAVALAEQPSDTSGDGQPVGSFPYMSPEQVRHESLTGQSDLFSAGVLLWEMLAGRPLFLSETPEETLEAVQYRPIEPPSKYRTTVPEVLDEICLRALARDPEDRYENAAAFLTAVNRYVYSQSETVTPVDLSRMVARFCPPEVRRPRSQPASEPGRDGDGSDAGDASGDGTVPMARAPRTRRAPTVRSFATHVEFEEVLAHATPLFPIQAIDDGAQDASAEPAREVSAEANPDPDETLAMSRPPARRGALVGIAAVVAIAAIGLGVVVAQRGARDPAAGVSADAGDPLPDSADAAVAAPAATDAALAAGAAQDAGLPDAPPRPDARGQRVRAQVDATARPPRRPGTLQVGANPWGDVYVDGAKVGRTPYNGPIAAGRHTVVIEFPVPGREQKRTFTVTIAPGETANLGVIDFSGT